MVSVSGIKPNLHKLTHRPAAGPTGHEQVLRRAGTMQTRPKTPMKSDTPDSVGSELAHSTSSGPLESLYGLQAPSLSRGSWPLVSGGRSGGDQGRALQPTPRKLRFFPSGAKPVLPWGLHDLG